MKPLNLGFIVLSLLCISGFAKAQYPIHIPVSNYGAIPDDGGDDLQAIRNAIAALPSSNAVLAFAPGTYDLFPSATLGLPTTTKLSMFQIIGKTNLSIQGNGATLLCHEFSPKMPFEASYYGLFHCWGCTDLEIRDLTVNMSRLPYTIGTCTGITYNQSNPIAGSIDLEIDPSFIPAGGNLYGMSIHAITNWRAGVPIGQRFFYTQKSPPLTQGNDFYISNIVGVTHYIQGRGANGSDPGYTMMSDLPDWQAPNSLDYGRLNLGDDVVIAHQFSGYIAFLFVECKRTFLSNLTVHSWPGMAVNMLRDEDIVIDGLQVIPDPQRPWPVTTTADAVHIANTRGSVQVQGCHLEGMLDDGFNSYVDLLPVVNIATTNGIATVTVTRQRTPPPFPANHLFEFYDHNMIPLCTSLLSTNSTNSNPPGQHYLTFPSSNLPADLTLIGYVCDLDLYASWTELSGTSVIGNRGNGFLLRRGTTVDNCSFTNLSGSGINIGPGVGTFNEGPGGIGGGGIWVQDCTFTSCNRGWGLYPYEEGAINVRSMFSNNGVWSTGPLGSIADVHLERLTIDNSGGSAITVRSCEQITIQDCLFGSSGSLGFLPDIAPFDAGPFAAQSLLFFHEAMEVSILNNSLLPGAVILNGDRISLPMYGSYTKDGNVGF